jgi:MOSC domain-containing protein YiiM
MNSETGKIVGIHIGAQKGASKPAAEQAELIAGCGVKGDSHAGLKPQRQISLFESESLQAVNAEGIPLSAAELSANLLTENIRLDSLAPGSFLRIGACVIEITEARKPCGSLTRIDRRLPKRLYRNLGVFGRIIEGGIIRIGDAIEILSAAHPQTTL